VGGHLIERAGRCARGRALGYLLRKQGCRHGAGRASERAAPSMGTAATCDPEQSALIEMRDHYLPTHPPGRYASVVPRFVNSVRDLTTGGVLKFNFLPANFDLEDSG
jgi:hypothetical protein